MDKKTINLIENLKDKVNDMTPKSSITYQVQEEKIKIKYGSKTYFIEFFNFNDNDVKSMIISLDDINILAISSKLTINDMVRELQTLLNDKNLKKKRWLHA